MAKHTLEGTGAPATTPATIGEHYTDTAAGKAYLSVGTSSAADWQLVGTGGGDALTSNPLSQFAATTSAQLRGVLSDETGTGAAVFATSPTLVTPVLGTPSALVLTNATGLPLTTGVTGVLPVANFTTGTPTGSKFVRDDGVLAVPPGTGTVTATGGNLTANAVVLGAGTTDTKVVAGISTDGTSALNLGVAGASVGKVVLANATSGTITIQSPTGALGTVTVTVPAATDTLVGKATTDTLTNKTLTSPTLTTPVLGTPSSGTLTNCTGLPVAGGGTGVASLTAYAPIFGGTTSTGAVQSGTVGTSGQVLTSNGAGALPTFQAAAGGSSKYRKVFKPRDNEPPTSAFATLDTRNGHPVLDFDTTTVEAAIFSDMMSSAYGGGNITVAVTAALTSATTGTLGWDVTFERDGTAQDIDSDNWATAQTITATTVPGTSGFLITLSVSITAGAAGTGSLAAGEAYRLRIRRDTANDTATGDAELWAVVVSEN